MKLLVCGGRDFADATLVFDKLNAVHAKRPIEIIIEGGAYGADHMAKLWAQRNGIHVCTVLAQWDKFGKGAGPKRNAAMLSLNPDGVLAFPGGRGTANMVQQAKDAGVKVVEVR